MNMTYRCEIQQLIFQGPLNVVEAFLSLWLPFFLEHSVVSSPFVVTFIPCTVMRHSIFTRVGNVMSCRVGTTFVFLSLFFVSWWEVVKGLTSQIAD